MITLAKAPSSGLNFGSHSRPRYIRIHVITRRVIRRADCIRMLLGKMFWVYIKWRLELYLPLFYLYMNPSTADKPPEVQSETGEYGQVPGRTVQLSPAGVVCHLQDTLFIHHVRRQFRRWVFVGDLEYVIRMWGWLAVMMRDGWVKMVAIYNWLVFP